MGALHGCRYSSLDSCKKIAVIRSTRGNEGIRGAWLSSGALEVWLRVRCWICLYYRFITLPFVRVSVA